jgi:DNA polymerase (family 10)
MDEKFTNKSIAEILRNIAAAYLLTNQNRFRIIAYEKAADSIEHMTRELKDIWEEEKLDDVPGLGKSLMAHLDEYFSIGKSKHFIEVLATIPAPVFALMKVPSIGPKKAYKLVNELKLEHVDTVVQDLKKAAEAGRIETIPSFGKKSQKDILEAIELFKTYKARNNDRMPLPYAFALATEVMDYLKKHPQVKRADALGSLRRMVSTIGDIDIAVQAPDDKAEEIVAHFLEFPRKISVDNAGKKKASIIASPNIRIDLRVQEERSYGSMLQYFTGSKSHNVKLREYALKKGLSLSEWGIKPMKEGINTHAKNFNKEAQLFEFKREEDFYRFVGVDWIPPEIREGNGEIEAALKKKLPQLIELKDISGDLHTHSSYDLKPSHDLGEHTYDEMIQKATELNYEYIGFADHNPSLAGNSKDDIIAIMKKRKSYIDKKIRINKHDQSKYFIGMETDILPNGEIVLPVEAIQYLDYMVISVHSSFRLGAREMTKRVLKALSYPKVKILGHPTGRLLGKREGFELEWEKIFEFLKEHDIAIEVNAWPERLDLPDSLVREAVDYGVKLCINTDAHARDQMDNMYYGVSVARRGWATKSDIINTLSYEKFKEWLQSNQ